MTEFPEGIRPGRAGDEDRLLSLFLMAHAENGYGDVDQDEVKTMIARACRGDNAIVGLVDGPERIEAAIGLHPCKRWYSSNAAANWYNEDLLLYVHPLHRKSRHAVKLFRFAQWWEEKTGLPVFLGLMPKDDFEDKERLFERFGRRVGSFYMIGGDGKWPGQVGTA